ncbi:MAG TPA: hypothetical protein VGO22_21050 [Pseudorhizobium sp.]|nr:hypothetical protein [Pseudorhizobium sp.]
MTLARLIEEEGISGIAAVSGWVLSEICELDHHLPGFAGHFLRASDERRQVIAAFVASHTRRSKVPFSKPRQAKDADVARFLAGANHISILRAAYGELPEGLRGALRRSGSQPHAPGYYWLLVHLLRGHRRPEIATTVKRLEKVDQRRLEIACVLPNELLHPDLIGRIRDRSEARNITAAVELLRSHVIDQKAFASGLRKLRRRGEVQDFFGRWVVRCAFARSPVPSTDAYRPIEDGPSLARIAMEYRNCSRNYAADLLEGTVSLGEFVTNRGSAIIYLVRRDGAWCLDDIYARRNRDVDPALRAQAVAHLRSLGINERIVQAGKLTPHAALRRFLPRGAWL